MPDLQDSATSIGVLGNETQIYLRLFDSLLTFSYTENDPYIYGYTDIRYYGLKKIQNDEIGMLEIIADVTSETRIILRL